MKGNTIPYSEPVYSITFQGPLKDL